MVEDAAKAGRQSALIRTWQAEAFPRNACTPDSRLFIDAVETLTLYLAILLGVRDNGVREIIDS